MPNWLRIVLTLSIVTLISGVALGGLNAVTKERIEINILKNKQMPAVESIFTDAENNLLEDRKSLKLGDQEEQLLFPMKKGGETKAVAFEFSGKGFGGDVGVMMGVDIETGDLVGIGMTVLSETPGVGMKATEPTFTKRFRGLKKSTNFHVKQDGGQIDAITGATITSRAVCDALRAGYDFWEKHQEEIKKTIK